MKKNYLYKALGLMGIMGTLSMGVVSADTRCWNTYGGTVPTTTYASGITYGCDGNIPVITIESNGKGITIKAMNEGSVKIGSGNDESSLYQWGNNHPFPNAAGGTISATSSSPVSAASYGPNNYYSGATWITKIQWDSSDNRNLWGGSGDEKNDGTLNGMWGFDTTNFVVINSGARKAMCPEGYHIPSAGEWNALMYLWTSNSNYATTNLNTLSSNSESSIGTNFGKDMMIPFVGSRNYDSTAYASTYGFYWSSSPYGNVLSARYFRLDANSLSASYSSSRAYGDSVRCFKNSYIEPPQTLNLFFMPSTGDVQEVGTGEVTEDMTGAVPDAVTTAMGSVIDTGYTFSGSWSLSGETTAFDFENRPISGDWADTSGNVYFFAQWTPITYTISFSGNAADATGTAPATINAEYDSGDIAPDNTFTMTGYTFTGWNTETDGSGTGYATGAELKNLTTTSGANVELYAQWEVNVHKLNFVVDGTTIQSGDVAYAAAISAPAEPKKDCNSFAGWTSSVEGLTTTGTMPDSDVIFTANWNYTCSRSSGGGGGSSRSSSSTANTQDSSTSSQNDDKTQNSSAEASEGQDNTQVDSSVNASEGQHSEEFQRAYEFASKNGITTMDTIEKANMDKPLTRIAMAKMLSYYAINLLGIKPDETRINKFNDIPEELDKEYDSGVTLAYQLGIMGINMPNNKFRPNDLVTRAEFGTALSRMLYGIADGKDKYYSTHLAKLMEEKIITNDDPKMKELRGYVMIMLMRSALKK